MLTITKEVIPEKVWEKEHTTCDLCGNPSGDDENKSYTVQEASIRMEEGFRYPGGSTIEATIADCCTSCFREKVIPALEAIGLRFRKKDMGW